MKLGGYAHGRGVTFFCDFFKIRGINRKGKMNYEVKWILPNRLLRKMDKKPFLSGITMLYYQWAIMDKKWKGLVVLLLLFYILEGIFPSISLENTLWWTENKIWIYGLTLVGLMISFPRIIKLFRYHGAEHKIINCYTRYGYVSYELVKIAPRFNQRCGSNIASIFILLYGLFYIVNMDSMGILLISFLLSIQIAKTLATGPGKWRSYMNILQWITVLEPEDRQIEEALLTFHKLQEVYSMYQRERAKGEGKYRIGY